MIVPDGNIYAPHRIPVPLLSGPIFPVRSNGKGKNGS
jgi:hypothetical protein